MLRRFNSNDCHVRECLNLCYSCVTAILLEYIYCLYRFLLTFSILNNNSLIKRQSDGWEKYVTAQFAKATK